MNIKKTIKSINFINGIICIILFTVATFYGFYKKRYLGSILAFGLALYFINGYIGLYKKYKKNKKNR